MKIRNKIAAILLAGMMALPAFSCSKGSGTENNSNGQGSAENPSNLPISTDQQGGIGFDEPVFKDNPENNKYPATTPVVTVKRGDDGKVYVNQTDINGTTVTQDDGKAATVEYTGTTLATSYAEEDYQPAPKSYFSMWLDTSKKKDFVFDGEFLVFDVKIRDDAKDGVYPIEIYHTDFANYNGDTLEVKTNVGYICVNSAEPELKQETGGALTLNVGNASGKPGDTVKLVVSTAGNKGFVGYRIWMSYDSKAVQIESGEFGKDMDSFASVSGRTLDESSAQ